MFALIPLVLLGGAAPSGALLSAGDTGERAGADAAAVEAAATPATAPCAGTPALPRMQPPTIAQALESGVLIVVSKPSQRMQVFKDGQPWLETPVSTGRRGHTTPGGVFPIMEKQRFHRSNIYSNAPMPFMQRLTSGGIAIHAGYVPRHPASHGCIRVPYAAAQSLFGVTKAHETIVVVSNEAMESDDQARRLALSIPQPRLNPAQAAFAQAELAYALAQLPIDVGVAVPTVRVAAAQPRPNPQPVATAQAAPSGQPTLNAPQVARTGQIIQLAAALSPQEAEARWSSLLSIHAELARFDKIVVPVVVGSRRYFRLRASGPGAFSYCSQLKSAGFDCFRVL